VHKTSRGLYYKTTQLRTAKRDESGRYDRNALEFQLVSQPE